jgi:predicted nucleic acid-binding protein
MTKLFIDSDIILDLLLKRKNFSEAAELLTEIEERKHKGHTTAIVIANVHYIMAKFGGKKNSIKNLRMLRNLLSILAVTEKIVDDALRKDTADFEDALQYIAAEKYGMDFIITRNKDDFKKSKLTVLSAREFLDVGSL